jgi:hypothetical protein
MKAILVTSLFTALFVFACSKLDTGSSTEPTEKCEICHAVPPGDRVHAAHVERRGYDCGICHAGYSRLPDEEMATSDLLHDNGTVDVVFSTGLYPLERAVYDKSAGQCRSVYCHGYFETGDSGVVSIRDRISAGQCESCHDITKMKTQGHLPHMPGNVLIGLSGLVAGCEMCHAGYSLADSLVNNAAHINGQVEPVADSSCTVCHAVLPPSHAIGRTQCTLCHVR